MVYTCMIGLFLLWPYLIAAKTDESVRFQQSRLTVNVKNTSLESVLRKVAEQAGISVTIYGRLDRSVTLNFEDLPLEKGIKKLLARTNTSFLYKTETTSSGHKLNVLEKVFIFGGGSSAEIIRLGANSESLPALNPEKTGKVTSRSPKDTQIIKRYSPQAVAVISRSETDQSADPRQLTMTRTEREKFKSFSSVEVTSQIQATSTILHEKDANLENHTQAEADDPENTGLEITSIIQDSIFSKMGLRSGDIIQNINGSPVADTDQLTKAIFSVVAGPGSDMLRIEIERDGKVEPIYVMME